MKIRKKRGRETRMVSLVRILAIATALFVSGEFSIAAEVVRYPAPAHNDQRYDYSINLLRLALSKLDKNYVLESSKLSMTQLRMVLELESARLIDVAWLPTTLERETKLLPIRIPEHKGLLGWRVGLVRVEDRDRFASVRTLSDLQNVVMGQGYDSPDLSILRNNGLNVVPGGSYRGLFKMLAAGRFDYFPRSIVEIWAEYERYARVGLVIEPHIVLVYKFDQYFFVNKRNTQLAEDIRRGLEIAIADGSFDKLFNETYGEMIRDVKLSGRHIIELNNMDLPPETPLGRKDLWFDPLRFQGHDVEKSHKTSRRSNRAP